MKAINYAIRFNSKNNKFLSMTATGRRAKVLSLPTAGMQSRKKKSQFSENKKPQLNAKLIAECVFLARKTNLTPATLSFQIAIHFPTAVPLMTSTYIPTSRIMES